ncbi:hypothetical protein ANO11243_069450 [Dothideomycetidae sp. 11243]|nr:hypothetical protein ANO11243_069450 [fungal sp. No.11243]
MSATTSFFGRSAGAANFSRIKTRAELTGPRPRYYSSPPHTHQTTDRTVHNLQDTGNTAHGQPSQSPRALGIESGKHRKEPPVLLIGFVSLIGIPPLVYYYWQYRDAHMKAKKHAILKDMQDRATRQT